MPPVSRRRKRWRIQPATIVLTLIIVAIVLYGVAFPIATFPDDPRLIRGSAGTLGEAMRLRTLQALAVLWFFFFGACIGSFLNVVIYRVPRGRTLLGSSYCPYCCHPIRMRHNIPVLGWLMLRGRCYDCRLPISARYPIVEAIIGAVFLKLAVLELFSGGRNLPVRTPNYYYGVEWVVFAPQWELIHIYGLHCGMLAVLLSWALIWYDGQRVPVRYTLFVFTLLFGLTLAAPHLQIVRWNNFATLHWPLTRTASLLNALLGTIGGAFFGIFVGATHRIMDGSQPGPLDSGAARNAGRGALSFALIGAALGWQAALSTALLVPVALVLLNLLVRGLFGSAAARIATWSPIAWFVAAWLHICVWKPLTLIPEWPGPQSAPLLVPVQLVIAIFLISQVAIWVDAPTRRGSKQSAMLNDE